MKLYTQVALLSLCMITLHAELLVIKKTDNGFAALDESDEINKHAISDIMLNYQWPMVIANSSLTEQERNQLLASDQPYAEENFIRAKLEEINPAYDVVFIPTTLYELFVLGEFVYHEYIYIKKNYTPQTPIDKAVNRFIHTSGSSINYNDELDIINEPLSSIHEKIYKKFKKHNNFFYPDAFFYINNLFIQFLLNTHISNQKIKNGLEMSAMIETQSDHIAAILIEGKGKTKNKINRLKDLSQIENEITSYNPTIIAYNKIIAQVLSLEYQARMLNKGLLLRGTTMIKYKTFNIAGTTLYQPEASNQIAIDLSVNNNAPYSISFGNSLFAGIVNDKNACVYSCISNTKFGYSLFINKKDYIEHRLSNSFIITPLSPLAALFAYGEFFHSRSKIAITAQNRAYNKTIQANNSWQNTTFSEKYGDENKFKYSPIEGACCIDPIDKFGLWITVRDELKHAQIFSQYLADNMRIIMIDPLKCNLKPEEKIAFDANLDQQYLDLKSGQIQAAQYYKAIKNLKNFTKKASQNFHKKKQQKELESMKFQDTDAITSLA